MEEKAMQGAYDMGDGEGDEGSLGDEDDMDSDR